MKTFCLLLCILIINVGHSQTPTSKEVLRKTLAYHDPSSQWPLFNQTLNFDEVRPDGEVRNTTVSIDNTSGFFHMNRGDAIISGMLLDSCFIEKGDIDCQRAATMRDYYTYLWGLPMKLMDANTPMEENVVEQTYESKKCYLITVNYEKDTWTFFIDAASYKMLAYRFMKKDQTGELIKLKNETIIQGIKIPKERSWYTIPDNKFLGTDILVDMDK